MNADDAEPAADTPGFLSFFFVDSFLLLIRGSFRVHPRSIRDEMTRSCHYIGGDAEAPPPRDQRTVNASTTNNQQPTTNARFN
jgi:hypothetical protein